MSQPSLKLVLVGNYKVDYTSETQHAKTLEAMGHSVVRLQEGEATAEEIYRQSSAADALIFIHTHGWVTPGRMSLVEVLDSLKREGVPTLTYHLDLWFGLKRQNDLETDGFYRSIQYFFTVDKLMAEWFNDHTDVKGVYLPAAVFDQEAVRVKVHGYYIPVLFVGSSIYHDEWPYRAQLVEWLTKTYRQRFKHVGPGGRYGVIRGLRLNRVLSETQVVVGDSLCINFDYPHYWSDRVYETIGRGGFIIHPYVKGMEEHFEDGKHLVFYEYGNYADLKSKIDYYLTHQAEREAIRQQGFEHVKAHHTYKNRWETILQEISK